jgi:hypothetical protein
MAGMRKKSRCWAFLAGFLSLLSASHPCAAAPAGKPRFISPAARILRAEAWISSAWDRTGVAPAPTLSELLEGDVRLRHLLPLSGAGVIGPLVAVTATTESVSLELAIAGGRFPLPEPLPWGIVAPCTFVTLAY